MARSHTPPRDASRKDARITVSLFMRKPVRGEHFSIERLFDAIVVAMPPHRVRFKVHVCPYESKGLLRRALLVLWAAAHQADVNHVTGDVTFLTLLMRRSHTVLTIHDIATMYRLRGWKRELFRWLWLKLPIRRAARVTVISAATKAELIRHAGAAATDIEVIPNCVPSSIVPVQKKFNETRPRILQIGTAPHKNLRNVIMALAELDCVLVVIGPVTESDVILAREVGTKIEMHADIPNERVRELLAGCDLVVFASMREGFGLPILEAQATGRPLITSAREPMKSVAGAGAILVDPDDVVSIRTAIVRVMGDPELRERLVADGLSNVAQYSAEAIAAQYASLYEAIYRPRSQ
jgi:glycosyltransferase involved in cell wall biosynthesis